MESLVDLGLHFYAKAMIRDLSKMSVCIGLDIFVEMELEQAAQIVESRIEMLMERKEIYLRELAIERIKRRASG